MNKEHDQHIHYLKSQLTAIEQNKDWQPNIKIIAKDGGTNWLSISWEEFERVKAALLGESNLSAAALDLLAALEGMVMKYNFLRPEGIPLEIEIAIKAIHKARGYHD